MLTNTPPPLPPVKRLFTPSLNNAFFGGFLFSFAIPPLAILIFILKVAASSSSDGLGGGGGGLVIVILITYAVTAPMIVIAGFLYVYISALIARFFGLSYLSPFTTSAVGMISSLLGTAITGYIYSHVFIPLNSDLAEAYVLASVCGLVLGGVIGATFPVGYVPVKQHTWP